MIQKVDLAAKFSAISEHWRPRLVGELNGQEVKLAKLQGEFIWHHHADEDELFMVVRGRLRIEIRGQEAVELEPGQFLIVPRGVEHRPVAEEEVELMLFEPAGTRNTGNVEGSPLTAPNGIRI